MRDQGRRDAADATTRTQQPTAHLISLRLPDHLAAEHGSVLARDILFAFQGYNQGESTSHHQLRHEKRKHSPAASAVESLGGLPTAFNVNTRESWSLGGSPSDETTFRSVF